MEVFKPMASFLAISGLYVKFPDRRVTRGAVVLWLLELVFFVSGVVKMVKLCTDRVFLILRDLPQPIDILLFDVMILCFSLGVSYLAVLQAVSASRNLRGFLGALTSYVDTYTEGSCRASLRRTAVALWLCGSAIVLSSLVTGVIYIQLKRSGAPCWLVGASEACFVWLYELWSYHRIFLYLQMPAVLYSLVWLLLLLQTRRFNLDFSGRFLQTPRTSTLQDKISSVRPEPEPSALPSKLIPELALASSPEPFLASSDSAVSGLTLEHFRVRHDALCRLVNEAVCVIGHFLLVVYGVGTPLLLLTLRSAIYGQLDVRFLVALIMAYSGTLLMVVTLSGALLSEMLRRPAEVLHQLQLGQLSAREGHSVTVFLARVQGPPTGFSVAGVFTIDTSTILMMLGTVLTYVVLILQLQAETPTNGFMHISDHSATADSSTNHNSSTVVNNIPM